MVSEQLQKKINRAIRLLQQVAEGYDGALGTAILSRYTYSFLPKGKENVFRGIPQIL